MNPCGTDGLRSIILGMVLSPSWLAGRPLGASLHVFCFPLRGLCGYGFVTLMSRKRSVSEPLSVKSMSIDSP